jgi:hypothetical protein
MGVTAGPIVDSGDLVRRVVLYPANTPIFIRIEEVDSTGQPVYSLMKIKGVFGRVTMNKGNTEYLTIEADSNSKTYE